MSLIDIIRTAKAAITLCPYHFWGIEHQGAAVLRKIQNVLGWDTNTQQNTQVIYEEHGRPTAALHKGLEPAEQSL